MSVEILCPGVWFAVREIALVCIVAIGLTLKRDVEIGPAAVAVFDVTYQPFSEIEDEERNIEHLELLPAVDVLVVEHIRSESIFVACKHNSEERYRDYMPFRHELCLYYWRFHFMVVKV